MAHYFVHPLAGKSSNNGLSWVAPFATLQQALDVATASADVVHLGPGIYFGGNYHIKALVGLVIRGYGAVMNCAGYDYFLDPLGNTDYYIYGLTITGFAVALQHEVSYPGPHIYYYFCTIYQKGALKDTTYAADGNAKPPNLINSTWWGVRMGLTGPSNLANDMYARNSIVVSDYVNIWVSDADDAYCASNTTVIRGDGGWDVATYPIPVYSEDPDTPDLRFDPNHAQYAKYATGGYRNNIMGNPSRPSVSFTQFRDGMSMGSDRMFGPWVNDYRYYDPSFPETIVSAAESNNKIDFKEAGAEITGTLADATHSTTSSLMTAVGVAMNAVATATITTGVSDAIHSTISTDGTALSLLSLTGTNFANSIYSDIGFDTTADHEGQTLYASDDPLTAGPGPGAPGNATSVSVTTYKIGLNLDSEPEGKSGRAISPVIDLFRPEKLKRVYVSKLLGGLGEIDNSGSDSTREIEVRASIAPFDKDDAAGTTTLDWTLIEYDGLENLDETYRYWQIRAVIRLDKVS